MAQPRLDAIILAVSKKAGDEVSSVGTDGQIWTAAQRLEAINDARKIIYGAKMEALGIDEFANTYREFISIPATIQLTSGGSFIGAVPSNSRKILGMMLTDDSGGATNGDKYEAKPAPPGTYAEILMADTYSAFAVSTENVKFIDYDNSFRVYGLPGTTYDATLVLLTELVPVTSGGTDIPDPESWVPLIKEQAYQQLLKDIQRRSS